MRLSATANIKRSDRMKKKIVLYDEISGEVFQEWEEGIEEKEKFIIGGDSRRFIKMFRKSKMEFPQKSYELIMTSLVRYLEMNTNRLVIEKYKSFNTSLQLSDMMKIADVGRTTFYEFLIYCEEKHYIQYGTIRGKHGKLRNYYVNPLYYLNSKHITVELFLRFKQDSRLIELLSDKDKEKILKYITK